MNTIIKSIVLHYIPKQFDTIPNHLTYLNEKNRCISKRQGRGFVYMFFGLLKVSNHCVIKIGFTKSFPITKVNNYSRIHSHFNKDFSDLYIIDILEMGIDQERAFHKACSTKYPNTCENYIYRGNGSTKSLIREIYRVDCFLQIYHILYKVYQKDGTI